MTATNTPIIQYPVSKRGRITCVYGTDMNAKVEYARKLKDDNTFVIDSNNSRLFITHIAGYSVVEGIDNNIAIVDIVNHMAEQGINVIVNTMRSDVAYMLLRERYDLSDEDLVIVDLVPPMERLD